MVTGSTLRAMRDIKHTRRANLRLLLEKKFKGDRKALAEALGIGQLNFLSRLLSEREQTSKSIGHKLARRIEQAAGKTPNWLDTDHNRTAAREPAVDYNAARQVPILDWSDVSGWIRANNQGSESERWTTVPCPVGCGSSTFALRVRGASMEPRFRENDLIFCDPEHEPRSGSFVIVHKAGEDEPLFRQLVIEGQRRYLKAANPQWPEPIEPLTHADVICGTVIFHGEEL